MFNCPIRHTSRDITKSSIPYVSQVLSPTNGCPAQFWECWCDILTTCLNRLCTHTKGEPGFFVFRFFTQVMGAVVFFRVVISACLADEKEKARLSICRLAHHQHLVQKLHLYTWNWAGHGQFTSLAVAWLAQPVLRINQPGRGTAGLGLPRLSDWIRRVPLPSRATVGLTP